MARSTYYRNTHDGSVIDFTPTGYAEGTWQRITAAEYAAANKANARDKLRKLLPPGATAHTILRRVSKSGMSRHISVVAGDCEDVTWLVARALGETFQQDTGSIRMGGCGMDMGFSLVYNLGRALYPDGFGVEGAHKDGGRTRAATKAEAAQMAKAGVKFRGRNGVASGWDEDGGYALNHRWL